MSGKLIATVYFYVISAGSLILIVIGIFNIVNFIINSTQYDKYPTRYSMPGDCEGVPYKYCGPVPAATVDLRGIPATPSAEELEKQKRACIKQDELDRKQHKIDDMKNAITFTLVGAVLFLIHFPLARKQSRG